MNSTREWAAMGAVFIACMATLWVLMWFSTAPIGDEWRLLVRSGLGVAIGLFAGYNLYKWWAVKP